MSFTGNINNVLNSKSTGMILFGATGIYKAYKDYKKAPYQEKKNVLLHDSIILAGSTVGIAAFKYGDYSFIKKPIKQLSKSIKTNISNRLNKTGLGKDLKETLKKDSIKSIVQNGINITKDCLSDGTMVLSGIFGAIGANYLIKMSHINNRVLNNIDDIDKVLNKPDTKQRVDFETTKTTKTNKPDLEKHLELIVNDDAKKSLMDSIPVLPELKFFSTSMVGMQIFAVSEEKTFKDKLKYTTKCLISNSLVPLFFLSLSTNMTKKMKSIYRVPIVLSSLVGGTRMVNKKLEPKLKILDTEFHNNEKVVY